MAENIVEATPESFQSDIAGDVPVVVDFWAEWCGPCKRFLPVIEEIAVEKSGTLKFVKVNVDTNQEIAAQLQVMSIPTLVFFKDGNEVDRIVGASSKKSLEGKLNEHFGV